MNTIRRLLGGVLLVLLPALASADEAVSLEFGSRTASELRLPVGRSQIIQSSVPLEQVVIGAPEVADIRLLTTQRVLILGIKPGHTNLVFRQKGGDLVALMNVQVGYDRNGIKQKLHETMPGEGRIEVRDSNDNVILAGQASSSVAMDMALAIARSFVPADKVVNLIQIAGAQQVMLEVRIAEVSRNSLKDLGLRTTISDSAGKWNFASGTALAGAFGTLQFADTGLGFDSLALTLQALEKKGLAKTLAEPNLVTLSGQEANFLAGGEFPIPVAQTSSASGVPVITVDYKEFGVGLRFTPTVLDAERINLKLLSEVSAIDNSQTFSSGSIELPAFSTRRAGTTVELGDGQSFAIAGLMQSDMRNAISQIPLLGSLPVLGALFRSTDFQRNETELVMVVTARLVKPVRRSQLAAPTDVFVPPGDVDQYLLGRLEHSPGKRSALRAPGVDGSFGHQLSPEKRAAK